MATKTTGTLIAAAAAALFLAGPIVASTAAQAADGVKCMGANACKGHGACKTASNACKGQNACKGKGITVTKTEADCTKAGGKVQKS